MRKWVLLIALLITHGAHAEEEEVYQSGYKLLALCEGQGHASFELQCLGYIQGVADASRGENWKERSYCVPRGVLTGQMQKIVVKYLNEQPEILHYTAYILVQQALLEAFPCK